MKHLRLYHRLLNQQNVINKRLNRDVNKTQQLFRANSTTFLSFLEIYFSPFLILPLLMEFSHRGHRKKKKKLSSQHFLENNLELVS